MRADSIRWTFVATALVATGCASAAAPCASGAAPTACCAAVPTVKVAVGAMVGLAIPGAQDLKFKRYSALGELTDFQFSNNVDSTTDPMEDVYAVAWANRGLLKNFGLQVEAAHWVTTAQADSFVNRAGNPGPHPLPPFDSVSEERTAFLATLLHRFPLPGSDADCLGPYWFVGLGTGPCHTSVTHGHTGWRLCGDAVAGLSYPMTDGLRLRVEGRYLLAPDADSEASTDWRVDTSGTPYFKWVHLDTSPGWPHMDTRFFDVLIGLELDL